MLAIRQLDGENRAMKNFTAVGFPGAHTQAKTLDELQANLLEVVEMLLEDGEPVLQTEFVGTQSIALARFHGISACSQTERSLSQT